MIGRIWPVAVLTLVVFALAVGFWALPTDTETMYDKTILHGLSIAFALWCVAMLIRTNYWSWLALAVLAAFASDSVLYAFLGGWYPEGWGSWMAYLIRALFVTSASMLIGQIFYDVVMWFRGRRYNRYKRELWTDKRDEEPPRS